MPIPNPLPTGVELFNPGIDTTWAGGSLSGVGTVPGGASALTVMGTGLSGGAGAVMVGTFAPPVLITLATEPPGITGSAGTAAGGATALTIFGLNSFIVFTPTPVPPGPPAEGIFVTSPGPRPPRKFPNMYDCCLQNEEAGLCRIVWWPHTSLMRSGCKLAPYDSRLQLPRQGRPVQPFGFLALPTPGTGNTLVLRYTPPQGYVFVLTGVVQTTDSAGFINGAGGLVWRIKVAGRWVKDFGDTTVKLGTYKAPFYLGDYYVVLPNDRVEYYVEVPSGAAALPGNTSCALIGWLYPYSELQRAWNGRHNQDLVPFERQHTI